MNVTEETTTRSDEYERATMAVDLGLNFFSHQADLLGVEKLERTKYLPQQLIDRYMHEALKLTAVSRLQDSSHFFAEIPGFEGVWASHEDLSACVAELRDVLFDWIVLKIEHNDRDIPVVAGISLNVI